MKAFIALLLLAGLFHMPPAWGQCAPGIPEAGNPECLPPDDANSPYYQGDRNRPAAQPQQSRAVWADRWGAIAIDKNTGQAGTVINHSSRSEAVDAAMHDCQMHGSPNCKLELAYHNQCAAVAWGEGSYAGASGPTKQNAESIALQDCRKGASNCKIAYSDCSLPVRIQ